MAMISANVVLVLSGLICLGVAGFMIYRFIPQEGRAPSALTKTDFRATTFAMCLFVLLITGVGLVAKGIF
jgi:hypothetical protein